MNNPKFSRESALVLNSGYFAQSGKLSEYMEMQDAMEKANDFNDLSDKMKTIYLKAKKHAGID